MLFNILFVTLSLASGLVYVACARRGMQLLRDTRHEQIIALYLNTALLCVSGAILVVSIDRLMG